MALTQTKKQQLTKLKKEFDLLSLGKQSLLDLIDEKELSEIVYNSNAIENSTLSLLETQKILTSNISSKGLDLREVYEAINLAKLTDKVKQSLNSKLSIELIETFHKILLTNIRDEIAGRIRRNNEYVRVGQHIAPPPEFMVGLLNESISEYSSDHSKYFLEKIAKFHLEFEMYHPFMDGNGRLGRVLINYQLLKIGFPQIIIKNKSKENYYRCFEEFEIKNSTARMEEIIYLAICESLHKRIAYLRGEKIISLAEYAKQNKLNFNSILNKAKRQTIPAFRENGVWRIRKNIERI